MIEKHNTRETVYVFHTGPKSYRTTIRVGDELGDDQIAPDGVPRPSAALRMQGLDDDQDAAEVTVFRAFGEDELRELAKLCTMAANHLRRMENKRRATLTRKAPHEPSGNFLETDQ